MFIACNSSKKYIFLKAGKKISVLILLAALCNMILPLCIKAENPDPVNPDSIVIENIAMSALKERIDIIDSIDTNRALSNWKPALNIESLSAESSFPQYPLEPMEGSRCLYIIGTETDGAVWHNVERSFSEPIDLSGYNTFFFAVSAGDSENITYEISLQFFSETLASKHYTAEITSGIWNGIITDISDFESRQSVDRIRFGIKIKNTGTDYKYVYNFRLDCIAASSDANLASAVQFMSSGYSIYGGESKLSYLYDPQAMKIDIASTLASRCFIESTILTRNLFSSNDAVRVRLANNSTCNSIIMQYATISSPTYEANPEIKIELTGEANSSLIGKANVNTYYFKLPADDVQQVKFTFDGASSGEITIYSITPVYLGYGIPEQYLKDQNLISGCEITSCRQNENGDKIIITGKLNASLVTAYKNSMLAVYELQAYEDLSEIFKDSKQPAENPSVYVSQDFTITINALSGKRSRLCSRFAVVIYNRDAKQNILIDVPHYITNPEITASYQAPHSITTKKGLISSAQNILDTGAAYTVVQTDYAKLVSDTESNIVYEFEDNIFYFNEEYVSKIDSLVYDYYASGAVVVLNIVMSRPSDKYLQILAHPGSISRQPLYYFAHNTETEEGLLYFRALTTFLAQRYSSQNSSHGYASAVIFGSDIGLSWQNYGMGKKSPADFVSAYSEAYRVVYNIFKSFYSRSHIYASIGNSWDKNYFSDPSYVFCGREICDLLAYKISDEGNISWRVALNPYSPASSLVTDWKKESNSPIGEITLKEIPSICRYFENPRLMNETTVRHIMLVNNSQPLDLKIKTAPEQYIAEYVAAYFLICSESCGCVDAYIIADGERFSSSEYDFYNILRYIDTDSYSLYTDFALAMLGITEWNALIKDYRSGYQAGRELVSVKITDKLPEAVTGSVLLWPFNDPSTTEGWKGFSAANKIESAASLKGYRDLMLVPFGDIGGSGSAVFNILNYPRDLSYAPYLSFYMYTDNINDKIRNLSFNLTLFSGNNRAEASVTLSAGMWHYIVCDFTDFSGIKSIERIAVSVKSAEKGKTPDGMTLVLGGINASSTKYDTVFLENKFEEERSRYLSQKTVSDDFIPVILVLTIGFAALLTEIAYIVIRKKYHPIKSNCFKKNNSPGEWIKR